MSQTLETFDFPNGVDRERVRAALDSVPTQVDRDTLVRAIDGLAAALRALTTERREERARHYVAVRELSAALDKTLGMVPGSDDPALKAELEWIRGLATTARGPEGVQS